MPHNVTLSIDLPASLFYLFRQGVTNETAGSSETGFTFNDVITMLIIDIFVYAVLAWYATNVRHNVAESDDRSQVQIKLGEAKRVYSMQKQGFKSRTSLPNASTSLFPFILNKLPLRS